MLIQALTQPTSSPAPLTRGIFNGIQQSQQLHRIHIDGEPVTVTREDGQWAARIGACGLVTLRGETQLAVLTQVAQLLSHDLSVRGQRARQQAIQ